MPACLMRSLYQNVGGGTGFALEHRHERQESHRGESDQGKASDNSAGAPKRIALKLRRAEE